MIMVKLTIPNERRFFYMLKVGLIGSGNTGNQLCVKAMEELNIPCLAVNSSDKDLETVPQKIPRIVLKTGGGNSQGTGKNRMLAKKYLKDSIALFVQKEEVKKFIVELDICFIAGSTGGGTGSGTSILMADILQSVYPDVKIITIGVLPVNNEALSAHVNTLEYLTELYEKLSSQTYMLYDNDRYSEMPSWRMMEYVNSEIIRDIEILSGIKNISTKYDSIDDEDNMRLLSYPGRIMIARVEDIKEKDLDKKTIEDMIIEKIKFNAHVELQRDKKVTATGIIISLYNSIAANFDNHIPEVRKLIGDPDHDFNHININTDRKLPNNVYLIMTGLSPINDRISLISDRIEEIREAQTVEREASALKEIEIDDLKKQIGNDRLSNEKTTEDKIDLNSIFSKFGI